MSRQAYSLDVLLAEVNRHAPTRNKASDGGLASPDHTAANPTSDHEALDGVAWTARDFTDDPTGGLDGSDLAHRLAAKLGKHPAMGPGAYVIHNARIISHSRLSEGWRPYDGYNAHRTHVHVSVADARSAYDNRTPWNLWAGEAPKPSAPQTPTIADLVAALDRFTINSENDAARERYKDAADALRDIAGGTRVRVPNTVAGVRDALRIKEEGGGLSDEQLDRIRSARNLLSF